MRIHQLPCCVAHPDPLAMPAKMVATAAMAAREMRASLESLARWVLVAWTVCPVSLALRVLPDCLATKGRLARRVIAEISVHLVSWDLLVCLARLATQESRAIREIAESR